MTECFYFLNSWFDTRAVQLNVKQFIYHQQVPDGRLVHFFFVVITCVLINITYETI